MRNDKLLKLQDYFLSPFDKTPKNYFFLFTIHYYYFHLFPFFTFEEELSEIKTWNDFDNYICTNCKNLRHEILYSKYHDFHRLPHGSMRLVLSDNMLGVQLLLRAGFDKELFKIWSQEFKKTYELEELNSRLFLLFKSEMHAEDAFESEGVSII